MADISIDEARAKIWINDVNNEIRDVEILLTNVAKTCEELPGEDDPIMGGIASAGSILENTWNGMIRIFKESQSIIEKEISEIVKTATELIDEITSYGGKLK